MNTERPQTVAVVDIDQTLAGGVNTFSHDDIQCKTRLGNDARSDRLFGIRPGH